MCVSDYYTSLFLIRHKLIDFIRAMIPLFSKKSFSFQAYFSNESRKRFLIDDAFFCGCSRFPLDYNRASRNKVIFWDISGHVHTRVKLFLFLLSEIDSLVRIWSKKREQNNRGKRTAQREYKFNARKRDPV